MFQSGPKCSVDSLTFLRYTTQLALLKNECSIPSIHPDYMYIHRERWKSKNHYQSIAGLSLLGSIWGCVCEFRAGYKVSHDIKCVHLSHTSCMNIKSNYENCCLSFLSCLCLCFCYCISETVCVSCMWHTGWICPLFINKHSLWWVLCFTLSFLT